ncbi:hypothetical protein EYC80_000236 [Monilinia laxa]|uniref:Uncharacterized protein n=1 Tax=Monilinia laxa TaxID=61186 RepID=A0A5N6K9Y5_MONLA|nr:hypothetical protein EYC80_000236 [Monilinia laxa]
MSKNTEWISLNRYVVTGEPQNEPTSSILSLVFSCLNVPNFSGIDSIRCLETVRAAEWNLDLLALPHPWFDCTVKVDFRHRYSPVYAHISSQTCRKWYRIYSNPSSMKARSRRRTRISSKRYQIPKLLS